MNVNPVDIVIGFDVLLGLFFYIRQDNHGTAFALWTLAICIAIRL